MRAPTPVAVIEMFARRATVAAVGLIVVLAGCSGAPESSASPKPSMSEVSPTTTGPSSDSPSSSTAAPQPVTGVSTDGLRAPAATLPQMSGGSAVPFDTDRLVSITDPAVATVVARRCDGGIEASTAFAIDEHHLVTVASALAEDGSDPASGVDPAPWLHLGSGDWVRGKVIGTSTSPGVAVIEVDAALDRSLSWDEARPAAGAWGAVVGSPATSDGGSDLLAAQVIGPVDAGWVPMSTVKAAAAGRSGPGHLGAPFVDGRGRVAGMVTLTDAQGDTMALQEAALVRDLSANMIDRPERPTTTCDADADGRMSLAWALLLERDGSDTDATQLGGRARLAKFGRVGVVDASLPPFVADRASGAVVLGPFASHKKAVAARKPVGAILSRLDLIADAEVMLVPRDTFPAEAPTAPTTIPVAPPSTRPATTKKESTSPDERANGDCSGPRSTRVISGAPSGYSYKLRSGPSSGASVVAMGANGRQVSVVQGSASNGFVKIALPDGRCVWGASANLG